MGQLSQDLRLVTQLRDVEEFSTEETAQILGLSVSAVKSRSPSRAHNAPRAVEPLLSTTEITRDQICEAFSSLLNLTRRGQLSTDG